MTTQLQDKPHASDINAKVSTPPVGGGITSMPSTAMEQGGQASDNLEQDGVGSIDVEKQTSCVVRVELQAGSKVLWSGPSSKKKRKKVNGSSFDTMVIDDAVLAGDSLYWLLYGNLFHILEFDLVMQSLDVIQVPVEGNFFKVMRAEGGGLGILFVSLSDYTAQLWKRKTDCDGVASWGLARIIELDKILLLKSEDKGSLAILGFAEENNVVFLWTPIGVFMIHLESLKFKKLLEANIISSHYPFESVYTAETCAGGAHDRAELLLNM